MVLSNILYSKKKSVLFLSNIEFKNEQEYKYVFDIRKLVFLLNIQDEVE